jgi:hypothetical protein
VFPEPVIDRQVARQPTIAFIRVLERHSVCPFPQQGLDELLSFAVGSRGLGPRTDVLEVQGFACLGKAA